jgi:organic radical activating enzyme
MNTLYIDEIFYSLQGEGIRIGYPSVFIRTALCNFTCKGFGVKYGNKIGCDSYKAVDKSFQNQWEKYNDCNSIIVDIYNIIPNNFRLKTKKIDIVLTGGEPLLHWNNPIYQQLIEYFISRGHNVTIETNGSLDIIFTKEYQKDIIFSTSVKLYTSGEKQSKRINIDALNNIFLNTQNSYLKFVTSKDSWIYDIKEIEYILDNISKYINVYLMPLGSNQQELSSNAKFVFEKAMNLCVNYSDRIHIRIYNDKGGV